MRSKFSLTGYQVTSRPRDRFSKYSKWLDTLRTDLVRYLNYGEDRVEKSGAAVQATLTVLIRTENKTTQIIVMRVNLFPDRESYYSSSVSIVT